MLDLRDAGRRAESACEGPGHLARPGAGEENEEGGRGGGPQHTDGLRESAQQEPGHDGSRANSSAPRGSNASRTLSPRMLKASVVINSATEGKNRYHQYPYW